MDRFPERLSRLVSSRRILLQRLEQHRREFRRKPIRTDHTRHLPGQHLVERRRQAPEIAAGVGAGRIDLLFRGHVVQRAQHSPGLRLSGVDRTNRTMPSASDAKNNAGRDPQFTDPRV